MNDGWFLFCWGLMLLWVMHVGFDKNCTASGKWNGFRFIPRLYGWVYKTLRLSPLVAEHSVVNMSVRLNPIGSQFSIALLWNLWSESVGYKISRPSWGLWHWRSEFNHRWDGILTCFSILILQTFCGKLCFVNFCFLLAVLESPMKKGWWGGVEILI